MLSDVSPHLGFQTTLAELVTVIRLGGLDGGLFDGKITNLMAEYQNLYWKRIKNKYNIFYIVSRMKAKYLDIYNEI